MLMHGCQEKKIFFVHTLHEICVCSHMETLGGSRDVFLIN